MTHHGELDGITIEAQADESAAVANGMLLRGRGVLRLFDRLQRRSLARMVKAEFSGS